MTPAEMLLPRLEGLKPASEDKWTARCPGHDDNRQSLSVARATDGTLLLKCHAGCDTGRVVQAIGLTLRDLFPSGGGNGKPHSHNGSALKRSAKSKPKTTYQTPQAAITAIEKHRGLASRTWTYHNAQGEAVGMVMRWDRPDGGKDILPLTRTAAGWICEAMPTPRPLYRLPALLALDRGEPLYITEGEKAADAGVNLGMATTTSAGGSAAATKTDWSPLAGKNVVILPDNDSPGKKYAEDVARLLHKLAPPANVRIVRLPGLPDGGDLDDFHDSAESANDICAEIKQLADAAPVWTHGKAHAVPDDLAPEQHGDSWEDPRDRLQPAPNGGPGRLHNPTNHRENGGSVDVDTSPPCDYMPFPLAALPQPMRDYVDACSSAIDCDPAYIGLPLLAAKAAAIGNTRRIRLKRSWTEPAILWGAIVGESGTAKSPA